MNFFRLWQVSWLTLSLILLSGLVSLALVVIEPFTIYRWLLISDLVMLPEGMYSRPLESGLELGQYWRLITPIFLHFGVLHLVFNLLWLWTLGSKIEQLHKRSFYLLLVLLAAISTNVAQYYVSGPMFGGMSGVVFALLSYTWLWDKLSHSPEFLFPPAIMVLMLLWLALGYSGLLTLLGLGEVANTAHLVGLVIGLLLAFLRTFIKLR